MVHISTSWWNIPQKRPAVIFNCPGATAYQKIYLLDLPNEILVDVFRLIKDPCALAQISLSCHRLHEVVEPLLWHSFQGDGHFEDFPRNPKDLKPFLLSILQRPELGSLVRVLKVANIQSSLAKVRSEDDLQKCDPNDRLLISNAVCQLSPPNPEKWFSAIYTGVSEVYFALLLSKLPKLETLYLGISWDSMPSMPLFDTFARIAVTERNSAEPVYLRGLTRLDVDWGVDQDDDSFELNEYKELLSLPSLKEFYGTQVCESDEGRHETRYPSNVFAANSLSIEKIGFEKSGIEADSLVAILTACKRLTSFSFDAGYICLDNQFESTFLVSEIHRLHGASIESLSFSSGDSSEELGTLGDLRCLSSLKDLRTSQDDLLGECYNSICENCVALDSDHSRHKDHDVYRCDRMRPSCRGCRRSQRPCVYPHRPETVIQPQFSEILPWSLETLVIWRCDESILEKLHEIVAVVPEHLPVLKNVVIEVMNYYHEPFDTLSEAFKLKNVCLRIDLPRPPSVENTGVGSTEYDDLSIPNYSGPVR